MKYKSVDIAPNREAIRKAVRERLTAELRANSITVQDLLIDNIAFTEKFQGEIEAKQATTQTILKEAAGVEVAKNKAQQAVATAEGQGEALLALAKKQSEANRLLAESITPILIQYQAVQKLSPNVQVMMVPDGQSFIMNADMLKRTASQK